MDERTQDMSRKARNRAAQAERTARLAAALRDNLRRRKEQDRARDQGPTAATGRHREGGGGT